MHKILAYTDIIFSSAGRANSITGQKLSVCVSVYVLTSVAQITTANHRHL